MGACFDSRFVEETDKRKARIIFESMQEECRYDNGHSYSGGIGMAHGVTFTDKEFDDPQQADDWIEMNAQKWGPALAVRCKGRWHHNKEFDGWVIGAICAC